MNNEYTALMDKLGYRFRDPRLLEKALTHSSYANEGRHGLESNERLEFLGDSVLGFVTAEFLFLQHPDLPEGDLTRIRAALVCEQSLYEVARKLDLGSYLKLGRGEEAGGGRERTSILADAHGSRVCGCLSGRRYYSGFCPDSSVPAGCGEGRGGGRAPPGLQGPRCRSWSSGRLIRFWSTRW